MIKVHKKMIVNMYGNPTDVIIPWKEYVEIEEILGLDLDKNAINDLKQGKIDRASGKDTAYFDLDSI